MRKIIITLIATIVLVAIFEKAKGQAEIISVDFPTTNATVGANLGLSISIWRLELFGIDRRRFLIILRGGSKTPNVKISAPLWSF